MQAEWQQFLTAQGAHIKDGVVTHFSSPADETNAVLHGSSVAALTHLGVIRVSGADARTFLHNQLSNDIEHLEADNWRLAAYCSPKGRTLAVLRIFPGPDASLYIILPRDIIEPTLKRLRMFVLMSQVTLDDVSHEYGIVGVSGSAASQQLATKPGDARLAWDENVAILKLGNQPERILLVGSLAELERYWSELATSATPVGVPAWQLLDIHSGDPQVFATTVDSFVPQMLNMHAIEGISFKKGCYPGQEIVARMYYLGKLKRRMYLAHAEQDTPPAPGDELFASSNDQGAGRVVMASPAHGGGVDLLFVAPISNVEAGPLHIGSAEGTALEILPLPYDVPLERKAS
ncbi:MAG: folate-binding protein YgfZ [Granulosicoccaceae bacterium]|jgi:folate-binding protein YgfZ